jgi:hypothetical protein
VEHQKGHAFRGLFIANGSVLGLDKEIDRQFMIILKTAVLKYRNCGNFTS